ncbi:hypothetical protein B0T09DRAFT_343904 [Sordaria sp. MPI-SDFR-AT-0083]|nr:hypothetical protein B0T09DRAFT_343904 [Sordaria sp. MPI-SDFR-AT-0083]
MDPGKHLDLVHAEMRRGSHIRAASPFPNLLDQGNRTDRDVNCQNELLLVPL